MGGREIEAKRLAVGDHFVEMEQRGAAESEGWYRIVREHTLTARGDYSTIVETDETTWTERYEPDQPVWLIHNAP
jgi:hypothetical protein